MIIKSTRLGQLEANLEDILEFPNGLPGFLDEKKFILVPAEENSPFAFLQSVTEANLTFLIVDPFALFQDYEFILDEEAITDLQLSELNKPQIFNIVTIPEKAEEMTANLLAPVIINPHKRLAKQIVLDKGDYTTRHRLFPNGFNKLEAKGGR